ncbi:hypothetical protein [Parafrankia sp. EUN1f]|uniref:hypothetical protein n=1 Tax=Parafrankia sp. EUN1f TaxID=102897 RepID=UPI0001C46467|nr:hypothetical protein [Parafrankia sp. EUN1f]EFC80903.1 hypothetical protein FrEUN1fDRAFT_6005 [Parafrankia sp. EUN1f]
MIEIDLTDPAARSGLQHGDVVRYDGPQLVGPGGLWRELLAENPQPAWAYLPDRHSRCEQDPWALLTDREAVWDLWWPWAGMPPRVTLVLRGGMPVPAASEETAGE